MEETLAAIARARGGAGGGARRRRSASGAAAADERERAAVARRALGARPATLLADARRAADELLARAEREVAELRRELTRQRNLSGGRAAASARGIRRAAASGAARRARARGRLRRPRRRGRRAGRDARRRRSRASGCWAARARSGSTGRIVEISGRTGRVTLETEDARLVVPADDVEVVPEPISGPAPRDLEAEELRRRAAAACVADARPPRRAGRGGARAARGLPRRRAAGRARQVVIIHGVGTGALRRAVREALRRAPARPRACAAGARTRAARAPRSPSSRASRRRGSASAMGSASAPASASGVGAGVGSGVGDRRRRWATASATATATEVGISPGVHSSTGANGASIGPGNGTRSVQFSSSSRSVQSLDPGAVRLLPCRVLGLPVGEVQDRPRRSASGGGGSADGSGRRRRRRRSRSRRSPPARSCRSRPRWRSSRWVVSCSRRAGDRTRTTSVTVVVGELAGQHAAHGVDGRPRSLPSGRVKSEHGQLVERGDLGHVVVPDEGRPIGGEHVLDGGEVAVADPHAGDDGAVGSSTVVRVGGEVSEGLEVA